ncbi:MAG TPA: PAS domain-containing protein [Terriglobales bacterium]|nr:PAS domain-containing protein [Terriglobales bacterium]
MFEATEIAERRRAHQARAVLNRILEAQAALLSREELLKTFLKNVPVGVAMFDRDMHYLQVSDRFCADYNVDSSQVLGRSHYEVFPDIPERWKAAHQRGLAGETVSVDHDRWERHDRTAWVRWEIVPWRTSGGIVGGILIFAEDITRHQEMEAALSQMSRRLIESQEQERARIGRELHDDIVQKLAILAIDLEQFGNNPSTFQQRRQGLRWQVDRIARDVQALSHELHASNPEYSGVVAGMQSWCREFGERQKLAIAFRSHVTSKLPREVFFSLFRVLQEALHNVVKHSGVKRVDVQLAEHSNEIHLMVSDSGRGFDPEVARQSRGLGLTSMEERARLVNGTIVIESKPMRGTTIHVRVPC